MHVWDLVRISGFTRVLLVRTCQLGAHPQGRPTPLATEIKNYKQKVSSSCSSQLSFISITFRPARHFYSNISLSQAHNSLLLRITCCVERCLSGLRQRGSVACKEMRTFNEREREEMND